MRRNGIGATVATLASIGTSACFAPAPGERAAGSCWDDPWADCSDAGPPACPAGEICSDRTPNGLWFSGAQLGDDLDLGGTYGPLVTAVGGSQLVHIHALEGWPFDAIGGAAFDAMPGVGATAVVSGRASGSSYLRVVEPGTNLLYDRIALGVRDVASVRIGGTFDWFLALEDPPPPLAWWAGVDHTVVVVLAADDGTRLVDEGIELSGAGLGAGDAWDRWTLDAAIMAQTVPIAVTMTDGTTRSTSMRLVDDADDIVALSNAALRPPEAGVDVGQRRAVCFRALSEGAAILDAPMTATGDAAIVVGPVQRGCVDVEGAAAGVGHLTIRVGSRSRTFEIPVAANDLNAERALAEASGEGTRQHVRGEQR